MRTNPSTHFIMDRIENKQKQSKLVNIVTHQPDNSIIMSTIKKLYL